MKQTKKNKKGAELKTENYTIQVKYSKEAIEKKMMKFISKSGDEFEISSDDMISFLVNQVNMDTLSPTFVDTEKINVVEVSRQLVCVLDEDKKKGSEIRINYVHPYPIEFALIEEIYKIAKIKEGTKVIELTSKIIEDTKKELQPEMKEYVKKFYAGFRKVKLTESE